MSSQDGIRPHEQAKVDSLAERLWSGGRNNGQARDIAVAAVTGADRPVGTNTARIIQGAVARESGVRPDERAEVERVARMAWQGSLGIGAAVDAARIAVTGE